MFEIRMVLVVVVAWLIYLTLRRSKAEVTWANDAASQNMKIVDEAFSDLERRVADLEAERR